MAFTGHRPTFHPSTFLDETAVAMDGCLEKARTLDQGLELTDERISVSAAGRVIPIQFPSDSSQVISGNTVKAARDAIKSKLLEHTVRPIVTELLMDILKDQAITQDLIAESKHLRDDWQALKENQPLLADALLAAGIGTAIFAGMKAPETLTSIGNWMDDAGLPFDPPSITVSTRIDIGRGAIVVPKVKIEPRGPDRDRELWTIEFNI